MPGRIPTIDLTDSHVAGDLCLRGIHPYRDRDRNGGDDDGERDHLWIAAVGLEVDGEIDLCRSRLRAPFPPSLDLVCDEMEAALNLSLVEIRGDLRLLGGVRIAGRVKLRGAQVHGDVWMKGAAVEWGPCGEVAAFEAQLAASGRPGRKARSLKEEEPLVFLQGARIDGFLMMTSESGEADEDVGFSCDGLLKMTALTVGRSLSLDGAVLGSIEAPDLTVCLDFSLGADLDGDIDLRDAKIGGSLEISQLRFDAPEAKLDLRNATIGQSLQLMRPGAEEAEEKHEEEGEEGDDDENEEEKGEPPSDFFIKGTVDLQGASCDILRDGAGTLWGNDVRIRMNHFVYRKTGLLPSSGRPRHKPSQRIVGDWLLAKRAEARWPWPWSWLPDIDRLRVGDFWEPWQLRRNWIFQQYHRTGDDILSIPRHVIDERRYRPQPFEQAIRVARAEGREDFAIQFEMLKQAIEWGNFNLLVRWWLGFAGIFLGSLWLVCHQTPLPDDSYNWWLFGWTLFALSVTLLLMVYATSVHSGVRRLFHLDPGPVSRGLTWLAFLPPVLVLVGHSEWWHRPFHFFVSTLIFLLIRFMSVFAHGVMRFGFGYLRRPIRAIITLILVFMIGWWGVGVANDRNMLVVAAAPVADLVAVRPAPADHAEWMGSGRSRDASTFARDVPCAEELSEPLYALDVLIPIVDLGEEARCEIRRFPVHDIESPGNMSVYTMRARLPNLPLNDHRFWWWMKALYAVAGWFIVSLSILTFAQANKTHAEPPTEHK